MGETLHSHAGVLVWKFALSDLFEVSKLLGIQSYSNLSLVYKYNNVISYRNATAGKNGGQSRKDHIFFWVKGRLSSKFTYNSDLI